MSRNTLYDKDVEVHTLRELAPGRFQIFVDRQYIHEVTSPPAFHNLVKAGITRIPFPNLNTATIDHVIATVEDDAARAFAKGLRMENKLREYCKMFDIELLDKGSGRNGIVHIVGPELGLTQPGMTIVCGDSHTSTHGAFGNLSYGIGTTQVEQVLKAQSIGHKKLKVRRIEVTGQIPMGVDAKDVALSQIMLMGSDSGIGYANEWGGPGIDHFDMQQRMTITNLGAECQASASYFNPDQTTIDFLRGRERVPTGATFDRAARYWLSFASGKDAVYDEVRPIDGSSLRPVVTWGVNPGQAIFIDQPIPQLNSFTDKKKRESAEKALKYMRFNPGEYVAKKKVDMVFIGSCTNGRESDLEKAAAVMRGYKANPEVKVMVVPGSEAVKAYAEREGLDKVFIDFGAEWRNAGCSMCLGMNTDRVDCSLDKPLLIASTSNRNFANRQGDNARTILMSPAMAAYAAITGEVGDVRGHQYKK